MSKLLLVMILFLLIPMPAYAYLDPGSGSMIVGAIIALAATLFYILKNFVYERMNYVFKGKKKFPDRKFGIVFYSEMAHYWNVFFPIIRELHNRNIKCTYLAGEENDPGLECGYENLEKIHVGKGFEAYYFLNRLEADLVIMTTPGLNVLQLKKSRKVKHYCHIVHGLEDTSTYAPYGVDYFDSLMVNGEHQLSVIRELERNRNLPEKKIGIIGSTYLDVMAERVSGNKPHKDGKTTLLLAPSWGEKGFLKRFGSMLLDALTLQDYIIILRPHPQSYKSETDMIMKFQEKYSDKKNLVWDDRPDGLDSMLMADIMISDYSGIIFDYLFLFAKPVIVTDFEVDPRKYDMNSLDSKSSTLMKLIREGKVGYVLKEKEISDISTIIDKIYNDGSRVKSIEDFRDKIYCHPGESGKRGADFIQSIMKDINDN